MSGEVANPSSDALDKPSIVTHVIAIHLTIKKKCLLKNSLPILQNNLCVEEMMKTDKDWKTCEKKVKSLNSLGEDDSPLRAFPLITDKGRVTNVSYRWSVKNVVISQ